MRCKRQWSTGFSPTMKTAKPTAGAPPDELDRGQQCGGRLAGRRTRGFTGHTAAGPFGSPGAERGAGSLEKAVRYRTVIDASALSRELPTPGRGRRRPDAGGGTDPDLRRD